MNKIFVSALILIGIATLAPDTDAYPIDTNNLYNVTFQQSVGATSNVVLVASCVANGSDVVVLGSCYTDTVDVLEQGGRNGQGWQCVYKNNPGVGGTRFAIATCAHR